MIQDEYISRYVGAGVRKGRRFGEFSTALVEYVGALSMIKQGKLKFPNYMIEGTKQRLIEDYPEFENSKSKVWREPAFDSHIG